MSFLVIEPECVVMHGEWAEEIVFDVACSGTENYATFREQFDMVGAQFLSNPTEDFYQGVDFMSVIRRKSDGQLFGYRYWNPIAKHTEALVEPNGDEHGFEREWDGDDDSDTEIPSYIWLPVKPFIVTGYQFATEV